MTFKEQKNISREQQKLYFDIRGKNKISEAQKNI